MVQAATWSRLYRWPRLQASSRLWPASTTLPATSSRPCIAPYMPPQPQVWHPSVMLPCLAMLCPAMLCLAMLCLATLCLAMLCLAMLCHFLQVFAAMPHRQLVSQQPLTNSTIETLSQHICLACGFNCAVPCPKWAIQALSHATSLINQTAWPCRHMHRQAASQLALHQAVTQFIHASVPFQLFVHCYSEPLFMFQVLTNVNHASGCRAQISQAHK